MPNTPERSYALALTLAAICLLASGCATAKLEHARALFSEGSPEKALAGFPAMPEERSRDALLFRLERATIRQTVSNYTDSAADFLDAAAILDSLDIASVSQATGTLIVNETVKSFRGVPFEQVLLHAIAANNYIALGQNDDAAVEARLVARKLAGNLDGFPDVPYARYLAGACLELAADRDGAAIEYGRTANLLPHVSIDPVTGRFSPALPADPAAATNLPSSRPPQRPYTAPPAPPEWKRELVCFVGIGVLGPADSGWDWSNNRRWGTAPYAEILINGVPAGQSVLLSDTRHLHEATRDRLAAARAVKTVARVGIKFAIANAVAEKNDALGSLVWLLLLGLENEDTRRWETLPRWLHAARVPCPEHIQEVRVVMKRSDGVTLEEHVLPPPQARTSALALAFARAL